jgi:hypothetical protein
MVREAPSRGPLAGRCTEITIAWPDYRFRCEIFPQNLHPNASAIWNLRDIQTGDNAFDAQFTVRGADPQEVRHLLQDGVRWQINRLHHLFSDKGLYVLIQRGQILIQRPRTLRYEDLAKFVKRGFELYDQIMLTRAAGIEFLAEDEAQPLGDVICKVCGEEIVDEMVFCRRCKTPHHRDCWKFTGACSVYGCGEKRYSRPEPAIREPARPKSVDDALKNSKPK